MARIVANERAVLWEVNGMICMLGQHQARRRTTPAASTFTLSLSAAASVPKLGILL